MANPNPITDPELASLLKFEAMAMTEEQESDDAFRKAVGRPLPSQPAPTDAMPDGGSKHRDGEGEWVRYSYDRPGSDQPAERIEPVDGES